MKRLVYLLIIVGAIGLVIAGGYFLRQKISQPAEKAQQPGGLPSAGGISGQPQAGGQPQTNGGTQKEGGSLPVKTVEQKFGVIAQNQVLDFFVDKDNNAVIVQPDGQIMKIVKGEASALSSVQINNLIQTEFSYDGKKIIASFGDKERPQYSVFDTTSKSWSPLDQNIYSATWSPNDYQIAYVANKGDAKVLAILDLGNIKAKAKELATLYAEDLHPRWISSDQIILETNSGTFSTGLSLRFDISKKLFTQIVPERAGLRTIWDKSSKFGLVFVAGNNLRGGELAISDTGGNLLHRLSFLTLPSKCSFYSAVPAQAQSTSSAAQVSFLACAIPRNADALKISRLPDAYEQKMVYSTDDFYKIDLASGDVSEIFKDPSLALDTDKVKIFNGTLFFVNRFDERLYAVSL